MYRVLKALYNTSDYANAVGAYYAFIDLRADTCKSVRYYICKLRNTHWPYYLGQRHQLAEAVYNIYYLP
jgi:hypothetical protein